MNMNIQQELARIARQHPAAAEEIEAVRHALDARADYDASDLADIATNVFHEEVRRRIIGTAHRIARLMKCPH